MIHSQCTDFEESMVKLVKTIGNLDEGVAAGKRPLTNTKQQRPLKRQRRKENEVLLEDDKSESEENDQDLKLNDDDNEENRQVIPL